MFKKSMIYLMMVCFVASLIAVTIPDDSEAKGFRSSSFRSSSFKSSKSSSFKRSSYSKKSSKSASKSIFGKRSGGGLFGKTKTITKTTKTSKKFTGGSKIEKKSVVTKKNTANSKSLKKYKQDKNKFKTSKVNKKTTSTNKNKYSKSPVYSKVRNNNVNHSTYYRDRNTFHTSHHWNMPVYGYNSYSSFGMYDSLFMWMMLDSINDAKYSRMYYNHQTDAGFQQWKVEADRLAVDNEELRTKLNLLDAEVSKINEPIDPSYTPQGVPVEMMLNPELIMPDKPILRIATGNKNLNYYHFGKLMQQEMGDSVDVVLIQTSGSVENLNLLKNGEVDACMVQSNVIKLFEKTHPNSKIISEQFSVYPEPVQMIAREDSGIDNVSDLSKNNIVVPGPSGSGTDKTWTDFGIMDSDYLKPQTQNMSYDDALKTMNNNKNVVMVVVAGLKSPFMNKVNSIAPAHKLKLVPVDDFGFFDLDDVEDKNGNNIYSVVEIPATTYPNMQKGRFWGKNKIETIAVDAIFLISTKWVKRHDMKHTDKVAVGLVNAQPKMLARVGLK